MGLSPSGLRYIQVHHGRPARGERSREVAFTHHELEHSGQR